jgi:2-(1,2-epoxy-1,2-dihydrophenyl)acetyl-CoA isomerase
MSPEDVMPRMTGGRGGFARFAAQVRSDLSVPLDADFDDGVATIWLDRPARRNALTRTMSEALLEAMVRAGADVSVRAVVLGGRGGSFCAGDDVATVDDWRRGDGAEAPFDRLTHDAHYLRVCEEMLNLAKPVVAVLTGATAGAGTELACAADYRLSARSAKVGSRLLGVGHVGNVVLMSRVVGPSRATEIYLTGRMVEADEAARIGLVDRIVDDTEVSRVATELGHQFAALATGAIALFKDLRERSWGQPAVYGLRMQDSCHMRTHDTVADAAIGIEAFTRRATPVFTGR